MTKLKGFYLNTTLNEEEVWYFLFGEFVSTKKKYCSPFRKDSQPGCKFFLNNESRLFFTDFADNRTFNAISALKEYYGCNGKEAIDLFLNKQREFKTGSIPKREKVNKSYLSIYPYYFKGEPSFNKEGFNYWKELGVTKEQLYREETKVFNLYAFSFDKLIYPKTPTFAYQFRPGRFKIYSPLANKGDKWFSNCTKNDYWHLKRGSEILFITKSNKDMLCVENLLTFDLMTFMNEGVYPTNLVDICRGYKRIIVNYDPDETGIREGNKLADILNGETFFYHTFKDTSQGYLENKESLLKQINNL